MIDYIVSYSDADHKGNVEVHFSWRRAHAQRYFNKLKYNPKKPVNWAELGVAHDIECENYERLEYFYNDERYEKLFNEKEINHNE